MPLKRHLLSFPAYRMSPRLRMSGRTARPIHRIVMILVLLLASTIVSLLVLRAVWQHRTAARIKIISPTGINSLEKIRLGGLDQWILIRGWSCNNPVLLLMHGGPGFPCMPFAHVAAELEKHFVV